MKPNLLFISMLLLFPLVASVSRAATTFYVSVKGNDSNPGTQTKPWKTVQKAATTATPGSTVLVLAGTYHEKVTIQVSGSAKAGAITFTNRGSDRVILDGTGKPGTNIITLQNQNYVCINGLEIVNDINVSDGSGIRLLGYGDHIALTNNIIHHITGADAMGITVYGTDAKKSISNLSIAGNLIYDCQPAHSETLTLNGNVEHFAVTNNTVHDVNNIGIDFIGGEKMCPTASLDAARNGLCQGNTVYRARSSYGGGYGAAIYVDGGHDIAILGNVTHHSDLGIEVGAENAGSTTYNILIADNLVYENDKAGIVFGGYDATTGRVKNCSFRNNTLYHNDTKVTGVGELWVQYASGCHVENNIFLCTAQNVLVFGDTGSLNNSLNYNLYDAPGGPDNAQFTWNAVGYDSYSAFRTQTHQDAKTLFADPKMVNAAMLDFHLNTNSPAINAGDPATTLFAGETDFYGKPRIQGGRIDIGANERK